MSSGNAFDVRSFCSVNADIVMKGTNFDGIYDCPTRNSNGGTFEHISYREFVARGLNNSMDMTAMQFCEENNIPGIFKISLLSIICLCLPCSLCVFSSCHL